MSTSSESGQPRTLHCVVVTPENAVLDEQVDSVTLPMEDGALGVLPGRAPLIGRLGYGELRLRTGKRVQHFYVDGGFVQVARNTVTVLTEMALRPDQIKVQEVREALAESQLLAPTVADQEAHFRLANRAYGQLRVAELPATTTDGE